MGLSSAWGARRLAVAGGAWGLLAACGGDPFSAAHGTDAGTSDDGGLPPVDGAMADDASTTDAPGGDARPVDASRPDAAPPPPADGGVVVTGTVVDAYLLPLAGVSVHIGGATATTGTAGQFTLPNVTPPYQAIAVTTTPSGHKHGYVFAGLARRDPTLQLMFDASTNLHAIPLTGKSATGTTPNIHGVVFADVAPPAVASTGNFVTLASGVNTFSASLAWGGPAPADATLYDLQWFEPPGGGLPSSYIAYATTTTMFTPNQPSDWQVPLSAGPMSSNLPVTVDVSSGYALAEVSLYIRPMGASVAAPITHALAPSSPVSLPTPIIAGATFTTCAIQGVPGDAGSNTPYGVDCQTGLGSNQSVTLTPPLAPTFDAPPSSAGLSTVFAWNGPANGISVIAFEPTSAMAASAPTFYVVTPAAMARIPDLSPLGLSLGAGATYQATVFAFAPYASLDAATTPAGFGAIAGAIAVGWGPTLPGQFGFSGATPFAVQ